MANKTKQWATIIVMIALFAMIAFVTHLCSPMSIIVKNQFGASNFLSQIGNYGNFIAYLIMGVPSGMLIKRYGYKKTALMALAVGILGILVQWASGVAGFGVYLIGAFISGFCMCMLNTVVNPMLNILGGGGNKGNQLIQIGNVFNSAAAVAIYILMGALIGDAAKAKISDATPALLIALAIFVIGFIVILFTKIQEPEQVVEKKEEKDRYSALSFRHFKLGLLAIFLYGGIEIGIPTYVLQYLTSTPDAAVPGLGISATVAGLIVAVYWLMMFFGRLVGGAIGGKVSSRTMVSAVASVAIVLILFGIFAPKDVTVSVPGMRDFVRFEDANFTLVKKDNLEYEQVFIIETKGKVSASEILNRMNVFLLPKDRPAEQGWEEVKDVRWTGQRKEYFTSKVKSLSKRVTAEIVPSAEPSIASPASTVTTY